MDDAARSSRFSTFKVKMAGGNADRMIELFPRCVMRREIRVQVFSSFEEANEAEHRRLAGMDPQARLREFSVLQKRRWGQAWGSAPMTRKKATWEKVAW